MKKSVYVKIVQKCIVGYTGFWNLKGGVIFGFELTLAMAFSELLWGWLTLRGFTLGTKG